MKLGAKTRVRANRLRVPQRCDAYSAPCHIGSVAIASPESIKDDTSERRNVHIEDRLVERHVNTDMHARQLFAHRLVERGHVRGFVKFILEQSQAPLAFNRGWNCKIVDPEVRRLADFRRSKHFRVQPFPPSCGADEKFVDIRCYTFISHVRETAELLDRLGPKLFNVPESGAKCSHLTDEHGRFEKVQSIVFPDMIRSHEQHLRETLRPG